MKILILGNSFLPENSPRAFRTTELVKEFARQGHEVVVIIPKYNTEHFVFEKEFNVEIKNIGNKTFKEINITSGGAIKKFLARIIRRGLNLLFYYPDIIWLFKAKNAIKKENGYDLLITIASPHSIHWGVALAWNPKRPIAKTWVADCGDPFMGTTTDTFKKLFYFKYLEKYWCKKVNYISVPFTGAIDGYYPEFRHKIRVIPQGFDFKEVPVDSRVAKTNEIPTFAYTGLLIPGARDPKPFIEYLLSLNIDFRFILYTQSEGMVLPFVEKSQGKIKIENYIPRKELLKRLTKVDFVVNFNNGVSTQLPSKLIDYYLINKPVLSIDSYSFDKRVIDEFLSGNYSNKYKFDNPEQYRIENVCQKFLTLLK